MYEDEEVWKEIPGWEGYEASTWYRVRSFWTKNPGRGKRKRTNEPWMLTIESGRVILRKNGKQYSRGVVKLMSETHDLFRCSGKYGCNKLLSTDQRVKTSRLANYCKPCDAKSKRRWRKKNPVRARDVEIRSRYSITSEQKIEMFIKQNGSCWMCELPLIGVWHTTTAIDHDNRCCSTGARSCGKCIRGLAHQKCNRGAGMFDHNPLALERVAANMKKFHDKWWERNTN